VVPATDPDSRDCSSSRLGAFEPRFLTEGVLGFWSWGSLSPVSGSAVSLVEQTRSSGWSRLGVAALDSLVSQSLGPICSTLTISAPCATAICRLFCPGSQDITLEARASPERFDQASTHRRV
jgi:hypothetical protein